ncbi:MAG: glycosyltransferase family 1 protein [Phormidesmis sp. CAN_BIN44]|nr:glycosyltransferase family 1 protein [Phormidesmis sp. CAN_BIN44]
MRILQVVGGMNRHGTETWLMNVLRSIDRTKFQMDFLVHTTEPQAYENEIRSLGSRVIPCLNPSKPWAYARNLKQILKQGSYDVVHSHIHYYSGFVLRLAHQAGVPLRIAQAHTVSRMGTHTGVLRQAYCYLMKGLISSHATAGVAVSQRAAAAFFGLNWQTDSRWQVMHCGIDLLPFKTPIDTAVVRSELGISSNTFVIGHVGRFYEPKNHAFLVEIFSEIVKREPNACLLLVGEGPLREVIERKISQLGLSQQVIFAGLRADVHRLMLGAMDVFLFPSLYEGLGLVLIEAQAAGVSCIFSDVVPEEADVIQMLTQRLSLSQTPSEWAEAVLAMRKKSSIIVFPNASEELMQTEFNILNSLKNLDRLYTRASHSDCVVP